MNYKIIGFFLFLGIGLHAQKSDNYQKNKFDILFYDAVNSRTTQDYGSAFDLLNYCYAMDSTNIAVAYELGNFYKTLNQDQKALELYKKANEGLPDNYYYGVTYGMMALKEGKFDDAIKTFSHLVKNTPSYSNLYFYLSEAYKQKKDYQEAINSLTKVEEINGLNEQISLAKYDLYKLLGEEKKAFAEIEKYIQRYPEESDYYVLMGDLYMQDDKPEKAKPYYERAKKMNPNNPYIVVSLSNYYEKVQQKDLAEQEMRQAILNPSMDVDTKMRILAQYASGFEDDKEIKKINSLFDTLMVLHPQEPKLNMLYGNLLMIQKNKGEAIEQYRVFAEANPSNPSGWEQMLSAAFPDSLDLSIKICQEALTYLPHAPQFYYYEGVSHYMKKEYPEALKVFNEGKKYVSESNTALLSDFYGQIGYLHFHLNDIDSAYTAYDIALKYNPNNIMVLNNYSYFLSLGNKNLAKAERMSGLTIKADPLNPTYLDTYGWIMFKQGVYSLAKTYLEKAMEYSQRDGEEDISAEMYDHYGDVLFKTGEKEKALEYWKKAKEALQEGEDSVLLDKKIETGEYHEK